MKCVAIYNNKGGVGKSTVSLFLSDFFASLKMGSKNARVLLIDLDAQSSCATALLGMNRVDSAKTEGKTISAYLLDLLTTQKAKNLDCLLKRPASVSADRKKPLCELFVTLCDRDSVIEFEPRCHPNSVLRLSEFLRKKLENSFDFVFIDLPANIDERSRLSHLGLAMADSILIPCEPTRIAINSLPDTLKLIQHVVQLKQGNAEKPLEITGLVLNKTDKRTRQYKLHHQTLKSFASENNSSIFNIFLPYSPTLSTASDDSLSFSTLKDRYDKNYNHVRLVAMELARKVGYKISKN